MWITIVLLSQLNRDGANGKPNKSQLRSSWSIEQDADVIILLYQDYDKPQHEKYVEFIIDKNRNWIETSLYLWVSKRVMMIYDVDQEECIHL
jgi:replicative DNA helicase